MVQAIEQGGFDVIVMNFANADMVGHSGKMEPTVRPVEAVDAGLGRVSTSALKRWAVPGSLLPIMAMPKR